MIDSRLLLRRLCLALLCAAVAGVAAAQDYPNKRITMIASFPPGGGTDLLARLVSQRLSDKWKVPVIVENRAGGYGLIGVRAAMTAAPDGYTLYTGSSNTMIMLPALYENLPFDTLRDFEPISSIANQHSLLVMNPSVPANSVKEFIALAKSKPGVFNFASPGVGSYDHMAMLLFQARTGIDATHVPYKGSADAVTALLSGGEVSVMFGSIGTSTPQVRAGRLKALAITSDKRSSALPGVPTMAEAGLPDFEIYSWNGVFAPAGTPKDILARVNREVLDMLRDPKVLERLASLGFVPAGTSPQEFSAQIKAELARWEKAVREVGIKRQPLS
jgi:tripartite-type tricarboxylate transporter receptor subunit TctC